MKSLKINLDGLEKIENKKVRIFKLEKKKLKNFIFTSEQNMKTILNFSNQFSISLDGLIRTNVKIVTPQIGGPFIVYDYLAGAPHAFLKDELHIFGGTHDTQKVGEIS